MKQQRPLLLSFLLLFVIFSALAQRPVPPLDNKRVHDDEVHVLSPSIVELLESRLKAFEDSTSNQIAILIIKSLEGEILEDYALRVSGWNEQKKEGWKLGQAAKDNGALLLIAVDDRKMRIEVGYGLEGVLTDAICNRIIRNEMAPNFRRGDYEAGVLAAVDAMVKAIGGEYVADETDAKNSDDQRPGAIALFIFGLLGLFTYTGLTAKGATGWVMYFFLIPFYAIFPAVALGWNGGLTSLGAYVVGYPILKAIFNKMGWTKDPRSGGDGGSSGSGGTWSSGSGWYGGGWGGGSSGGGGFGGFSGGGGSFGGGGSSGSW